MNTQKQNEQIEWDNLHICDQLETVRTYLTGIPSMQRIVDDARLYIAHLRGRVGNAVPVIEAPLGLDGQVQSEWLLEMVKERMESLRDEAISARQSHDAAEDALNDFASRLNAAAR